MAMVIRFQQVSKKFKLNPSRPRAFMDMLVRRARRATAEDFWALNNVSLDIPSGETVGLVGPNGAGKSTMLKLISRIIEPSSGTVTSRGRVTSLLELGAGFHPDLSGRENVYLNASILGVSRRVIRQRIDEIVDFANIGSFIDVPVRNYSLGMSMRLGFAITTMLDPEILLIDEVLAVGDRSFQRKCLDRLDALRRQGVTTLFVSHSLDQVQRLCSRVIWIDRGQVCADGDPKSVLGQYVDATNAEEIRRFVPKVDPGAGRADRWGTYQAEIGAVELLDGQGAPRQVFMSGGYFCLRIHYRTQIPVARPAFGLAIYRSDGLHLNGPNTVLEGFEIPLIDGTGCVDYAVERLPLSPGQYELSAVIYDHDSVVPHDHHHRLYRFEVRDTLSRREEGILHIPAAWRHVPDVRPPDGEIRQP